jgi:exosortase/archaeosortase family protein
MSKKRRNKKKNQASKPGFKERVNAWFSDRNPVLKFLLGFIGCMSLFYFFYYSGWYKNYLEFPFLNAQVQVSNALLHLFGQNTAVDGTTISSPEFSVNVKNGCDGLEAMAILISGILIFPVTFRYKIPGLLLGVIILLFANLLRIAGLYLAGLYFSDQVFEVLHIQGGFIFFTLLSILLWFIWMNWASNKMQKTHSS